VEPVAVSVDDDVISLDNGRMELNCVTARIDSNPRVLIRALTPIDSNRATTRRWTVDNASV
jgi:hypothetical protein